MFSPGELAAKQHRAGSRLLHEPGNTGCFSLLQVRAAGKAELLGSAPPSHLKPKCQGAVVGDRQGSASIWLLGCEGKTKLHCSLEEG